jgi:hypothetical protein
VGEERVVRMHLMESSALRDIEVDGACRLSRADGLVCLHRIYVMRTSDARATFYRER